MTEKYHQTAQINVRSGVRKRVELVREMNLRKGKILLILQNEPGGIDDLNKIG
jgi:hypothetical protein